MLTASLPSRFCYILALLYTCSFAIPTHAQSTEADLKARLINKPLYLRGFYSKDKLSFDASGHLRGTSNQQSFTLSGVQVMEIHLNSSSLIIDGRRMGLEFSYAGALTVPLLKDSRGRGDVPLRIEIDAPSGTDFGPVLHVIFAENLADIVPSMPALWQEYARSHFLPADAAPPSTSTSSAVSASDASTSTQDQSAIPFKVGGSVLPPVLLHSKEPKFNKATRTRVLSGDVLIGLTVQKDGYPSEVHIIKPMGLGLDEDAVEAVKHYVFRPATLNGNAVPVKLNVQVNFQIF